MLRIGSVPYLVAKPLTAGLDNRPDIELSFAPPSELAQKLLNGELEIALASSVLSVIHPELRFWHDGPIVASDGEVQSVAIFLHPEISNLKNITSVALDSHSRTGKELTKIILQEHGNRECEFVELDHASDPIDQAVQNKWQAVQLIGDPAICAKLEHPDWTCIDLGVEWSQLTSLPFVFAGWIGRADFDPSYAAPTLEHAAELGLSCLEELADEASRSFAASASPRGFNFHQYLTESIHYHLPPSKVREAIDRFAGYLNQTCKG